MTRVGNASDLVLSPDANDTHSTTGTTPSGIFVGRAGGDDAGSVGPDGAEIRAREHSRRKGNESPEQHSRSSQDEDD